MNKKDLDALNELYLSIYDGEQLDEAPLTPEQIKYRNERAKLGVVSKGGKFVATGKVDPNLTSDWEWMTSSQAGKRQQLRAQKLAADLNKGQREVRISRAQNAAIAAADKAEKEKATEKPTKPPVPGAPPRPAAGGSTPPPRPAPPKPSGPVLSKKKGVEGTGVGANFKERAFTAAEKSRYASVAAQNAARTSASSGAATPAAAQPKPAAPAVGKLGSTSFERRTPTSAELRAAQGARDKGASPEKALQAAQKTNLPTTGPTPAIPDLKSVNTDLAKANSPAVINKPAPAGSALAKQQAQQKLKPPTPGTGATMQKQSYEWPSAKTIRDIAGAYASIYEAKKVDQDQDGDTDFADVRIARMIASGMSRAEAIAAVRNKSYNEEVELWVNELVEEGYDLSEYTWEDMFEIYLDEATRMRKELGKEGEIATRKELARRSNAYQRSGSVDKTIAAAEREADRTVPRNRDEATGAYRQRMADRSGNLRRLAANRRKSVRSGEGLRGYAAKVEGSDRDLQSARGSARSAGTLTPREKKQLNMEAYEAYEFVVSYLLENNFASTVNDANVIINNMSENWFESIMEDVRGVSYNPNPIGNAIRSGAGLLKNTMNRPSVQGAIKTGSQMLQKSVPSGGYSTREGDGKPRETPLWDGPSKPTPTTPTKPQTKKQPPMRDEPLW